jgi:hypothetical protein
MRITYSVVSPVCYAAKRNPWFAQNIHATNFLCSIELICLICWLKIVMIIHQDLRNGTMYSGNILKIIIFGTTYSGTA